jgi:hypothetical protein
VERKRKNEPEELTKNFLLSKYWDVTPWEKLNEKEIVDAFEFLNGREAEL